MEFQRETSESTMQFHKLSSHWILWAHLPHNTDWSMKSYIQISKFTTLEEAISVTEILPSNLVENCMLFLMLDGVKPTWEDEQNRNGGCFSYKISNKCIYKVWKDLTYVTVGSSISESDNFVKCVTGITISPKKNFGIIKIWMTNCTNQNASVITTDVKDLVPYGCLFKKNVPEY